MDWLYVVLIIDDYTCGSYDAEDVKNMLASNVIAQILKNACWLNVHFVPPDSYVFEVRVIEGYGARWSADGSKVVFLLYSLCSF